MLLIKIVRRTLKKECKRGGKRGNAEEARSEEVERETTEEDAGKTQHQQTRTLNFIVFQGSLSRSALGGISLFVFQLKQRNKAG